MFLWAGFLFVSGLLVGLAGAQTMTEFGAAVAGSTVGGAAGKSVSDGITSIFGKVNQQTVKAAGKDTAKETTAKGITANKDAPVLSLAPSVARDVDTGVPPPPPPLHSMARPAASLPVAANLWAPVPFAPSTMADALPLAPIPPPPTMTPDSLQKVTVGMSRAEVLKLGDPSSRVAMFEDGHMVETFSYRADGQRFGMVRMQDGAVAKVDVQ
jgi:hypothetical protein